MLPGDPLPWLLDAPEPAAVWIARTALLGLPPGDPDVAAARDAVLADDATLALIDRIPAWGEPLALPGHDSPLFAPNLLELLATMGVGAGDHPRIERTLDAMLAGRVDDGRLATFATSRVTPAGAWSALLCDTHAIVAVLVRYGRGDDPIVRGALDRMADGVVETADGAAWPCVPWGGFRGPGRKGDRCPQVTLEALAAFGRMSAARRTPAVLAAARDALEPWRRRGDAVPYMFGHGARFKTVKWPGLWYGALRTVETLALHPDVWRGTDARLEDRRSMAEILACLVAYNVAADGTVTPRSCNRGFEGHSFGRKDAPSPYATARIAAALVPFAELADEVAAVDVLELASSRGGSGTPRPPAGRRA